VIEMRWKRKLGSYRYYYCDTENGLCRTRV